MSGLLFFMSPIISNKNKNPTGIVIILSKEIRYLPVINEIIIGRDIIDIIPIIDIINIIKDKPHKDKIDKDVFVFIVL